MRVMWFFLVFFDDVVGAFEVKDKDNGNGGADDDDNMVGTIVGIFLVMAANCQDIYLKSVREDPWNDKCCSNRF